MELKSFTVKKSQWLRGEGSSASYLLRPSDNKMCCLGFASLACGAKTDDITLVRVPSLVFFDSISSSFNESNLIIKDIMEINDLHLLSDEERMFKLKQKFQELGIEVIFED